jgi:hypothetical protein
VLLVFRMGSGVARLHVPVFIWDMACGAFSQAFKAVGSSFVIPLTAPRTFPIQFCFKK